MSYNSKVYLEQGGDRQVVADGGSIDLGNGAMLTVTGTNLVFTGLPTSDPAVDGALWRDGNSLAISAG